MLRLRGGGKKRKKKQYTTPKKNKHKRKKEKLRVLKYYKVDDSGKVTRLRKECPIAGPGHFMANHAVSNPALPSVSNYVVIIITFSGPILLWQNWSHYLH